MLDKSTERAFRKAARLETEARAEKQPELVGFSKAQEKWIGGLLDSFGLPLGNIERIRKASVVELKAAGMEGAAAATAFWDPILREIVIIDPELHSAQELRRVLYHELSHGVLDPFAYMEIDPKTLRPIIENGIPKFRPEMLGVFKTEQNVVQFVNFMQRSVEIALATGVYVNHYQKILGQKFHALEGDMQVLIRKASDPTLTSEKKEEINKDIRRTGEDLQIVAVALLRETWAIVMEMAFVNQGGLKQKSSAQKAAWEREALVGEPFDVHSEAQYFLRLFYQTDDAGVQERRDASKQFVENNTFPK